MSIDNNSFAELLVFLRTHPTQRKQLLAVLSEVDLHKAQAIDRTRFVPVERLVELSKLPLNTVKHIVYSKGFSSKRCEGALLVDRTEFMGFVDRQRVLGLITYKEGAELLACNRHYLIQGNDRGYWTAEDGWVRKQDVIDHVLTNANAQKRAAFVERLEAFEARLCKHEATVVQLRHEDAVEEVQMELALNA